MSEALDKQIGGNHYKSLKQQPIDFAAKQRLSASQLSILKYVSRHQNKKGKEDLLKAVHFCELGAQTDDVSTSIRCMRMLQENGGCGYIVFDESILEHNVRSYVSDNEMGVKFGDVYLYVGCIIAMVKCEWLNCKKYIQEIIEIEYGNE